MDTDCHNITHVDVLGIRFSDLVIVSNIFDSLFPPFYIILISLVHEYSGELKSPTFWEYVVYSARLSFDVQHLDNSAPHTQIELIPASYHMSLHVVCISVFVKIG